MRRLTITALVLVGVLAACSGDGAETDTTAAAAELEITIVDFAYTAPATASVGDTVTVTNEDTVGHTWTEVDNVFHSGTLAQGDSFEMTFEEAGEFEYFCQIHPEMTGTITVEG